MDGPVPHDTTIFDPTGEPMAFRHALGTFATGVTIITCDSVEGPVGITANSFASVSLDPPLVLWSPAKTSSRFNLFRDAAHFAIHILSEDQRDAAAGFTRSKSAFDGLDWTRGANGVPLLTGALAVFECALQATHDAGDHLIIIGQVTQARTRPGTPLVFQGGRYRALHADD